MPMASSLLLRLGLGRIVRHFKWCCADHLGNCTTTDALRANENRFVRAVRGRNVHALQVRLKRTTANARDLGTDAAQILLFTARRNAIANLCALAARCTLPTHRKPRLA